MSACRYFKEVERWFDGEPADNEAVARHVADCPSCAAYLARLRLTRRAVASIAERVEISDAQFEAFLAPIREAVGAPRWRWRQSGRWAMASFVTAALIVAVAVFSFFTGGPTPVEANSEVLSCTTDVNGARADAIEQNGIPAVWVYLPDEDLW